MDDFLESVERTESDAAKAWNLAEYVSSVSLFKCYWCVSLVLTVSLSTGAHRMTVFTHFHVAIVYMHCCLFYFIFCFIFSHLGGGGTCRYGLDDVSTLTEEQKRMLHEKEIIK